MSNTYYSTSEVAEILNLAPSTLRFWDSKLKDILNIKRNNNGYRKYTTKDIENLKKIKTYLYEQKYSINEVRHILNHEKNKKKKAAHKASQYINNKALISSLMEKIDNIEEKIDEVRNAQNNLKHEYLQTVKMLNIIHNRQKQKLIKEIQKQKMDEKKKQKGLLYKLLPWSSKD